MSVLNEKSKQNQEASLIMKDHGYFAPAVHSAYYACLQKVLYILERDYSLNYDRIVQWCRKNRTPTHVYCINELSDKLRAMDRSASATFKSKLKDLKGFREDADYSSKEILNSDVLKALAYSSEITNLIKLYFNESNR